MGQNGSSAEIFRSSWSVYDAIIEHNHMAHREIHALVRAALSSRAGRGPFRMLDLGCGNARLLADTLKRFPPADYLGVDLSRPALEEAAEQLRGLPAVQLREQDMLSCMEMQSAASLDVIYSSFAMHHLSAEEKVRLFEHVARSLKAGGEWILVDVIRAEGQSRETYLQAYREMMINTWSGLTPNQIEQVWQHISQFDFPETLSTLAAMARNSGMGELQLLAQHGPHAAMTFKRTA